ncbi:phosphopantetheine-binding protein [Streptomyces sp. NPDC092296]|uniref:phosphopantetheine-binding protein n=1 Tax=Streptomyces sp. NPDC092296 TaxID=3366012 RepID=UPI0038047C40
MITIDAAELTERVAGFYRETLGDDGLDAESDFFEAGGDSLSAFQIIDRLQELVGVELAVALVFTYPSPSELAAVIIDDLAAEAAALA